MNKRIGQIEHVPLRDVWEREDTDFTTWLGDNIEILGEKIGKVIVSVDREMKTESAFSVDLVVKDDSGKTIIVENQLEKSDHDHLGKLITYLTAMQASVAVWIVSEARPEHIAAVGWLNESSGVDFYLFLIEAIRIDSSLAAPLLTLISGPSEVAKFVGKKKIERSEREQNIQRFWEQLVSHPDAYEHKHISPATHNRLQKSTSGVYFGYTVHQRSFQIEVYIDLGKGKDEENAQLYTNLKSQKDAIEKAFQGDLIWNPMEESRACCIIYKPDNDFGGYGSPESEWINIHRSMTEAMNRIIGAIRPRLDSLDVEDR